MSETESKQLPYWYSLLDQWVIKDNNSGLTLPFIIGAKHECIIGGKPDENAIEVLFREIMSSSNLPLTPGLAYCNTLKAYIFTLVDQSEIEDQFFSGTDGQPCLVLVDQVFGNQMSFDWIVSFMKNEYSETILKGNYSRSRSSFGGWEPFDESDYGQIKKSLMVNQND